MSSSEPNIMNSERRPTLSTIRPKIGVKIMADSVSMLDRNPPVSRDTPCASMKNFTAKVWKGKMPE